MRWSSAERPKLQQPLQLFVTVGRSYGVPNQERSIQGKTSSDTSKMADVSGYHVMLKLQINLSKSEVRIGRPKGGHIVLNPTVRPGDDFRSVDRVPFIEK